MIQGNLSMTVSKSMNFLLNFEPARAKGHTGVRQWKVGSYTAASDRQNLDHAFSAFHVLSHYMDHLFQ